MAKKSESSKQVLRSSIKEMIKAGNQLIRLREKGLRKAGVFRSARQRLSQLEKQLELKKGKGLSESKLIAVGKEVRSLVSQICKALISYILPARFGFKCRVPSGGLRENCEPWKHIETLADGFGFEATRSSRGSRCER
jgi:hypothetical protein